MDVKKLDKIAFSLLSFLNDNAYLKPKTLAEVYNEKFNGSPQDSTKTLEYLNNNGYISIKIYEGNVRLIQVDHLGKNYESILDDNITEKHKERKQENRFKIITILLSGLLSLAVSIIVNR